MVEGFDLTRLDGDRAVAFRNAKPLDRAALLASVAAWQRTWDTVAGRDIGLYLDDAFDFACALFGAWHAGKRAWLPGDVRPATVERLLRHVDACGGALPGALQAQAGAAAAPLAQLPADAELVVFTSGSTGEPTAIPKKLVQLDAEVQALEAVFGAGLGLATVFATVSHQHIYGLLFRVLWPLAAGRPFDCARLAYPEQIAALPADSPAVLVASPAQLRRLGDQLDWSHARTGLRAVFSSGGPLPADASRSCHALLGRCPAEVYGSSETGGIAWRRRSEHGDVWQALPGVEWTVEAELLSVRSAHLPEPVWTMTQDRVAAAGEGGFVLLGRDDRIAKIEEKRISLTAVERLLAALPEVDEARAFVLASPAGERVAVVAVPTPHGWQRQAAEGLRAFNDRLRAVLAPEVDPVGLPRRFRWVRSLPADSQGKVTDARMAALFRPLLPEAVWLRREPTQARARLDVTADLAVFDGHFDGMPVLPGVAQIDWIATLAGRCFALPPRFLRSEQIKFLRPVCPPLALTLALDWTAATGVLRFTLGSDQGAHASGRLVWGAPPDA